MSIEVFTVALLAAGLGTAQPAPAPPAPANPTTVAPTADTPVTTSTAADVSEAMARQKLLDAGYDRIDQLTRTSNGGWMATVKRDRKDEQIIVAADGTVTRKPAR